MLNAVHAMYPQYEFLESLSRSQTLLTQVAIAPQSKNTLAPSNTVEQDPVPTPTPSSRLTGQDDASSIMAEKRRELDHLEFRLGELEQDCRKIDNDVEKLRAGLQEINAATDKKLNGTAASRKPGRGAAYQTLYEQGVKVRM
jgi:hypothetical protein